MPGITAATPFRRWGTLAGIGCAYFLGQRWRIADPIAALVVAVFIFKVAFDLIRTGLGELLERSLPDETEQEILGIVTADPEVGSGTTCERAVSGPRLPSKCMLGWTGR